MSVFLADEQDLEVDGDDLVALVRHVLDRRRVPSEMEVSVLLVDRDTIAVMNAEHLGGEGPTDVLAFPIDEPGEAPIDGPAVLGDVVLCPVVAAEQARRSGHALQDELRILTVHGLLHLTGMDHATPAEEQEMFGLTDELLGSYAATRATSG